MDTRTKTGYTEGILSIVANTGLFVLKYWAGIVSGSVALIADAWHTLSDTISSLIVILGIKLSNKKPTPRHPFGYGRIEQIAAIFIGFLLGIVAYEFLRESINKFSAHETARFGTVALVVTIVSILVKEGVAQYALRAGKKVDSDTLKADGWHHRSDALSSVIILIGIFLKDYFWWIDSMLGIIISGMLFYAVYDIVSGAIRKLLGEQPSDLLKKQIEEEVMKVTNKDLNPHHFHIHNYGQHKELTFHIKLEEDTDIKTGHALVTEIEKKIAKNLNIETTIHLEPLKTHHHTFEEPYSNNGSSP
ncbi:MAG: cation diffusion facilitator family transporter [Bacteroidales bacterium]|nr:cation diffusion facilitator family transporter [Bacteroidales bacterium]MCF8333962.1 cation diffusion facilitator family transporter [Bacteroidales bacterium]